MIGARIDLTDRAIVMTCDQACTASPLSVEVVFGVSQVSARSVSGAESAPDRAQCHENSMELFV